MLNEITPKPKRHTTRILIDAITNMEDKFTATLLRFYQFFAPTFSANPV